VLNVEGKQKWRKREEDAKKKEAGKVRLILFSTPTHTQVKL
jgi:hypothetical protein